MISREEKGQKHWKDNMSRKKSVKEASALESTLLLELQKNSGEEGRGEREREQERIRRK